KLLKVRYLPNGLLQLLFELLHVVLAHDEVVARANHIAANALRGSGRVLKISTHGFLDLLTAVHQPQHDEQSHHGRHKIRITNLPGAAMMACVTTAILDDDNRAAFVHWVVALRCGHRLCCLTDWARSLYVLLGFLKRRARVSGDRAPPHFHRDARGAALDETHGYHAQDVVVGVPFFRLLRHFGGERPS